MVFGKDILPYFVRVKMIRTINKIIYCLCDINYHNKCVNITYQQRIKISIGYILFLILQF